MRTAIMITSAAALLAGCTGEVDVTSTASAGETPARVAARLDCPDREGDLRLMSTAQDGRACAYRGEDGVEVELRLAASSELPSLESQLKALIPAAATPPEPPAPPRPFGGGDHVGVASDDGERTQLRLPGLSVDTDRDRASVRMPGVRVNAEGENADVRIGGDDGESVNVRAHEGGAVVRIAEGAKNGRLHATFLVTSDEPGPTGWRLAGYQARGSEAGPVVVGIVRAREERRRGLMDDVEDLIDRNVKG